MVACAITTARLFVVPVGVWPTAIRCLAGTQTTSGRQLLSPTKPLISIPRIPVSDQTKLPPIGLTVRLPRGADLTTDYRTDPPPGLRVTGKGFSLTIIGRATMNEGRFEVVLFSRGALRDWLTLEEWKAWWRPTPTDPVSEPGDVEPGALPAYVDAAIFPRRRPRPGGA